MCTKISSQRSASNSNNIQQLHVELEDQTSSEILVLDPQLMEKSEKHHGQHVRTNFVGKKQLCLNFVPFLWGIPNKRTPGQFNKVDSLKARAVCPSYLPEGSILFNIPFNGGCSTCLMHLCLWQSTGRRNHQSIYDHLGVSASPSAYHIPTPQTTYSLNLYIIQPAFWRIPFNNHASNLQGSARGQGLLPIILTSDLMVWSVKLYQVDVEHSKNMRLDFLTLSLSSSSTKNK